MAPSQEINYRLQMQVQIKQSLCQQIMQALPETLQIQTEPLQAMPGQ